jgi:two-component system cell cycle sensor histidine kinase PleC
MAKIEAGKMSLAFEPVSIEAAAQTVFASIRSLIKPNVILVWDVQADLPAIEADQVRMRQILTNLLSNAAKFTEDGHIRLEIFREDENHLHIAVHDTGIGIADSELDVLFKAFEQVDNSTTRNVGGTGLGLPITKWLVTMHEGDIWVKSVAGKGTSIHIRLPLQQSHKQLPVSTFIEALTSS